MRYASVCSGIEAPTVAWGPLGWEPVFYAEIEAFPRAVLAHHYPGVSLEGDFTELLGDEYGPVDLLVGGTPCQSFSVAGRRAGLGDPRGNLALEFLALAGRIRPRWILFENVPGLLSIDGGSGFATFLRAMVECGYGCSWRVLDAQYAGVPQRRRRLWVVGHLGDWRPAAAVLFERESLRRDSPPRREAGARAAGTVAGSPPSRRNGGSDPTAGHLIAPALSASGRGVSRAGESRGQDPVIATAVRARDGARGVDSDATDTLVAHSLRADSFDASEDGTGRGTPLVAYGGNRTGGPTDVAAAVNAHGGSHRRQDFGSEIFLVNTRQDPAEGIQAVDGLSSLAYGVRRLTPRECERLMGLPDDYTLIPWRGKPADACPDGPRYRAIGNSMVVPELRWLGERIALVEEVLQGLGGEAA